MKKKFYMELGEGGLSETEKTESEKAIGSFIKTSVPIVAEYLFVGEEEIQRLNREMRGVDKVTDVLSFPALSGIKGKKLSKKAFPYDSDEEGRLFLGSVVVCVKRAKEQAEEYGHSFERELRYLLVHGTLHCLGYDHEDEEEKKEMREKEEEILRKLGIGRETE